MDGRTDGRTDGRKDGWMEERKEGRKKEKKEGTNKQMTICVEVVKLYQANKKVKKKTMYKYKKYVQHCKRIRTIHKNKE